MTFAGRSVRVLIVPGLYGSGPAHWQTWLQSRVPDAVRVEQDDWAEPDVERWSARIAEVLAQAPSAAHVAVAHSFGCLALAHHLGQRSQSPPRDDAASGVLGAVLVAPAEPERFRLADRLPRQALGIPSVVFASDTDPWMSADSAQRWARSWGSSFVNLGDVGHINAEAGFGPLPRALHHTRSLIQRIEQSRRVSRAHVREFSFAV
jgi:predicted alpha/beta hydrolase family esterase